MSELAARLAPIESGFLQMVEAARYFEVDDGVTPSSLTCWCRLRERAGQYESMVDLLADGTVREDEVRGCFLEDLAT